MREFAGQPALISAGDAANRQLFLLRSSPLPPLFRTLSGSSSGGGWLCPRKR